mmetsp:Transcript_12161/g.29503  ORF Transcript_12161/g.29503 Transcript_12161/m.29503 type:complete len:245 (+) Transcript_12161:237-971(+)
MRGSPSSPWSRNARIPGYVRWNTDTAISFESSEARSKRAVDCPDPPVVVSRGVAMSRGVATVLVMTRSDESSASPPLALFGLRPSASSARLDPSRISESAHSNPSRAASIRERLAEASISWGETTTRPTTRSLPLRSQSITITSTSGTCAGDMKETSSPKTGFGSPPRTSVLCVSSRNLTMQYGLHLSPPAGGEGRFFAAMTATSRHVVSSSGPGAAGRPNWMTSFASVGTSPPKGAPWAHTTT